MIITPSDGFIRPADTTAYDVGDLVANSTTAGNVVPLTFDIADFPLRSGVIGYVRVFKDDATVTNANFNLHLFTKRPIVTNGDNGALATSTAENYLGLIACDLTSGAFATTTDVLKRFQILSQASLASIFAFDLTKIPAAHEIYGLLAAAAAYTPASGETFRVWLEIGDDGGNR